MSIIRCAKSNGGTADARHVIILEAVLRRRILIGVTRSGFGRTQWQLLRAHLSEFPTCSGFLGTRKSSKLSRIWMVYTK